MPVISGELGALAFGGPELAYAGDSANAAYAADISSAVPGKAPARTGERSRDLTFWAQGLGGWGHTDSDGNAAAVHGRFGGFLSGVDARFGETLRAGFVAGYMRSDLNADARSSSAGIDSVQFGAYAGGKLGALNVRGGASYSFDSIDVSRGIFFPGFTDKTKRKLPWQCRAGVRRSGLWHDARSGRARADRRPGLCACARWLVRWRAGGAAALSACERQREHRLFHARLPRGHGRCRSPTAPC